MTRVDTWGTLLLVAMLATTVTILGGLLVGMAPYPSSIALLVAIGALWGIRRLAAHPAVTRQVDQYTAGRSSRVLMAVARVLSISLLLPLVRIANHSRAHAAYSLTVLAVGAGLIAAVALGSRVMPGRVQDNPVDAAADRHGPRIVLTAVVFVAALWASWFYMSIASTPIAPDTGTYWATLDTLRQRTPGEVSIRTPLYSTMFALVHAVGGSGLVLIAVQFVARALGCAFIAYLLAPWSIVGAAGVGFLLAFDPVSASMSVFYLTESLYTSGMVLALALVVGQLQRGRSPGGRALFGAGIAFGWAFLFRPSGMAMLIPVLGVYLLVTRSVRRTCTVLAGSSVVFGAIALFNVVRSGVFTVAATGLYVAFPLFSQHLFDPGNGPTSAAMHRELVRCDPELDYTQVVGNTSNAYIHGKFTPCLLEALGGDRLQLYDAYGAAYREALAAQPITFVTRMALEAARFLAVTVSYYAAQVTQFIQHTDFEKLCNREGLYEGYGQDFIDFVCPLPAGNLERVSLVPEASFVARMVYQPYLYVYDQRLYAHGYWETTAPEMTGAAAMLYFGLVLVVVPVACRPWVAGAAVVAVYNAAVTAAGQVTMLRYVAMDSPFFLLITGLFVVSISRDVVTVCTGGRFGGSCRPRS